MGLFFLKDRAPYVVLAILVILSYGHSLSNGFAGDDIVKLVNSDYYSNPANLKTLFSPDDYLVTSKQYAQSNVTYSGSGEITYRPVVTVSYFIDRAVWGLNPFGFHFINLLLHLVNTLLVYYFLTLFVEYRGSALLTAVLFAVHPMHAEVVNGLSYRHGLLAALFSLVSLVMYVKHHWTGKGRWLAASLAAFFLALFSKEYAVNVFFIVIAYTVVFERGKSLPVKTWMLFAGVLGIYAYIYYGLFPSADTPKSLVLADGILVQLVVAARIVQYYVVSLVWPVGLTLLPLDYRPMIKFPVSPWAMIQILVLPAVFIAPVIIFRRNKFLLFAALWFVITLLSVSNLIPLVNPVVHRRMYFPSIGFFMMAGHALNMFLQIPPERGLYKVVRAGIIVLAGICMLKTAQLTGYWKNNVSYAEELIRRYPWNTKAYYVLGEENFRAGLAAVQEGDCGQAVLFLSNAKELGIQDSRIEEGMKACNNRGQ